MTNEKKQFRAELLVCGCCGKYFRTWQGYIDQDQDRGYGICEECQDLAEGREKRLIKEQIEQIIPHLKPENQAKIKKMSYEQQKHIILGLIEKGALVWKISK